MKYMLKFNQAGSMSMLTVIFLALILTSITLSFVRLSVTEQRQSIDDDLTSRALYAAESGIEDAKRGLADFQAGTINAGQLEDGSCDPVDGHIPLLEDDLEAEYTCQFITLNPPDAEIALDAWETAQIPLRAEGGGTFTRVHVEWYLLGDDYASGTAFINTGTPIPLKTNPAWNNAGHPPIMRLNFFYHPSSGNLSRSSFTSHTGFLNPGLASGSFTPVDYTTGFNKQLRNVACGFDNENWPYACTASINGVGALGQPANQAYLRIQSLYVGSHVRITLLNVNTPVNMDGAQAVVDVTGRAGDVYRRLEARIDLSGNDFPFPDFGLVSAEDICKNFTITDQASHFVAQPAFTNGTTCNE